MPPGAVCIVHSTPVECFARPPVHIAGSVRMPRAILRAPFAYGRLLITENSEPVRRLAFERCAGARLARFEGAYRRRRRSKALGSPVRRYSDGATG